MCNYGEFTVIVQVSVHTISLMLSTCMIPHIEASDCRQNSQHVRLQIYIQLSWFFSTCLGLALFLIEVAVIFFVQFLSIDFPLAAYCGVAVLLPALAAILFFSCHFYRILRVEQAEKLDGMHKVRVISINPTLFFYHRICMHSWALLNSENEICRERKPTFNWFSQSRWSR